MKILIAGANGQVGRELCRRSADQGHEYIGLGSAELDITNAQAVDAAVNAYQPDVVINAAAYTAVDKAEDEVDRAFAVNRDGPANLARACHAAGIPLLHISTDYVFDGSATTPYKEEDPVKPLGVYGQSKLEGEQQVQVLCPHSVILRTAWVFSAHGNNFVKTMIRLARERDELRVVADQHGCPTSATGIADALLAMAPQLQADQGKAGIYHFCQPEPTSWHGFAQAIMDSARPYGGIKVTTVQAIATSDYPTRAARPAYSVLDTKNVQDTFGLELRNWHASLEQVIDELLS
ncbi:MAG: dTDP-4-dehydrorhamnose reductase [Gammaproteobacteria bacterium]|nr:dTDP-4-dehydrorhamnose reductase [Gammaproteobacteria bacterium]